jgi:hypothetical protein
MVFAVEQTNESRNGAPIIGSQVFLSHHEKHQEKNRMKNKIHFKINGHCYECNFDRHDRWPNFGNNRNYVLLSLYNDEDFAFSDDTLDLIFAVMEALMEKKPTYDKLHTQMNNSQIELIYYILQGDGFLSGSFPTSQLKMFYPLIKANHSGAITQSLIDKLCETWNKTKITCKDFNFDIEFWLKDIIGAPVVTT